MSSIVITGRTLQDEVITFPKRVRREITDNDTLAVYLALIGGDLPRDHELSMKELALMAYQSVGRLYTSMEDLEKKGYIHCEERARPKKRPYIEIQILPVALFQQIPITVAPPTIVPLPMPAEVIQAPPPPRRGKAKEPVAVVAEPPTQGALKLFASGWGSNPTAEVNTLIDQQWGWDPKTVAKQVYARESRAAKLIAEQYDRDYVVERLRAIYRAEPVWKSRRISTDILLTKLPTKGQTTRKDYADGLDQFSAS